jgi:uncharacterized membrane protein YkvA (DUF1232 family)
MWTPVWLSAWEDAMFGRSAAGETSGNDASSASRNEERVRRGFWPKIQRVAARLPFAEDLLSAYYCAFDSHTPLKVRAALLAALAYFVLPTDFMPDVLPLLGFTDDALVLVTALRMVSGQITDQHREAARQALARVRSDAR